MVIVIVTVDEPKDDICDAETIITGVFHGFNTEDEAEKWINQTLAGQKVNPNAKWHILESNHFSSVVPTIKLFIGEDDG